MNKSVGLGHAFAKLPSCEVRLDLGPFGVGSAELTADHMERSRPVGPGIEDPRGDLPLYVADHKRVSVQSTPRHGGSAASQAAQSGDGSAIRSKESMAGVDWAPSSSVSAVASSASLPLGPCWWSL